MKYIKVIPTTKEPTTKSKRKWLWEFSKKIVFTVTIIFVAVFLFACVLLYFYPDSTALQSVIDNISDVFKVTVVSYAVKAGFQNCIAISKHYREDYGREVQEDEEETDDEEEVYSDQRENDS